MMHRTIITIWVAVSSAISGPVLAQSFFEPDARGIPTIAPMIDEVTGAVVNISVSAEAAAQLNPLLRDPLFREFFDLPGRPQDQQRSSVGSGVIVDADSGFVLTNHHVIEGAGTVEVTLRDRRTVGAEIVGSDPGTDIAVLRIRAEGLSDLPMGSSGQLRVGDFVIAVGNPFGIGQTVTSGIVSALGRSGINPQGYEDFVQTDASINPGNSGGALVTLDGRLVGINTAILSRTGGNIGIGFAVPIDMARAVMDQIVEHGEVRRGELGVVIRDLTADLAKALDVSVERGAIVTEIMPGSVAEAAGLLPGDVVVGVDGAPVTSSRALRNRIGLNRPGEEVVLDVYRGTEEFELSVRLGAGQGADRSGATPLPTEPMPSALEGATIEPLEPDHPAFGEADGVVVSTVERGSAADRAGLRPGDLVSAVNREPVASPSDLDARLAAATGTVALTVWRDGREMLLVLEA